MFADVVRPAGLPIAVPACATPKHFAPLCAILRRVVSEIHKTAENAPRKSKVAQVCSGFRCGRLTAVAPTGESSTAKGSVSKAGRLLWRCACDCGGSTVVTAHRLAYGNAKSCGCLVGRARPTSSRILALHPGMKVGGLTLVLEEQPEPPEPGKLGGAPGDRLWLVRCHCGLLKRLPAERLAYRGAKSCGCGQVARMRQAVQAAMTLYERAAAKHRALVAQQGSLATQEAPVDLDAVRKARAALEVV